MKKHLIFPFLFAQLLHCKEITSTEKRTLKKNAHDVKILRARELGQTNVFAI